MGQKKKKKLTTKGGIQLPIYTSLSLSWQGNNSMSRVKILLFVMVSCPVL